jgi:hypothetical protein
MVILEHARPDGSFHYDWMLARSEQVEAAERALLTFRVNLRVDEIERGVADAARLPDHRGRYLWFEGDLGGNRGVVRRVAEGLCTIQRDIPGSAVARFRWAVGGWRTLTASAICGPSGMPDAWLLEIEPSP